MLQIHWKLSHIRNIEYDGYYWMIVAMEVDLMANSWRLELARLDIVGS